MFKEQMSKFKNIFKSEDGNNKKKIENLVAFVIILIITIIVINVILKEDDNIIENTQINNTKTLAKTDKENIQTINEEDELKENLEEILSKISGVGKVDVLITYSQTSQTVALYNEDSAQSDTEEKDSRWRK